MKKILSIFAAALVAIAVNAAVININTETVDALRKAVASASTGDIIEMAAGTYVESTDDYIAFHGKEVVVRAAEGAEVIVKTAVPIRLKTGGRAEFDNIKFDCSALTGYSNLIVPADDTESKRVVLNNCEFYNWAKNSSLIQSTSSRRLDSIVINNCYFHNCEKSMVFVENANLVGLEIKNSTFANITATVTDSYYAAPIYVKATTGKVLVDHCTFYNVATMSLSYGVVTVDAITDATVSNCIFMLPATEDKCATKLPEGGAVKNCLTYNYDNWQPYGHYKTATLTDCVKADPLFVDPDNNNFTLSKTSPAMTMNDGQPIGDPRWVPAPAPEHTFTVAGDNVDVFGTSWDPTNTANDMVLQEDNTYKWEKTGLTLPKGQIAFKVVKDRDWNNGANAYPKDNYIINIAEAGIYTIDIYYNPNDNDYVGAVATKTGDAVVIPTIAMHGNFLGNWADTENFALAEGNATASLKLTIAAGNYEFGMRIGSSGNWTSNGVAFTRENSAAVVVAGSGNLTLAADVAGEYTFTWTYETNTLSITFPTATAIGNTNAAVKAVKMIENGQMIIIKNGVKYNAQGAIVK